MASVTLVVLSLPCAKHSHKCTLVEQNNRIILSRFFQEMPLDELSSPTRKKLRVQSRKEQVRLASTFELGDCFFRDQ